MAISTIYPKFENKKTETEKIIVQSLLKIKSELHLDITKCIDCRICADACPKKAITVNTNEKDSSNHINLNAQECSYCGICTLLCPTKALKVFVNKEETVPILDHEGFPQYDNSAEIKSDKCVRCTICSEACPRDAIIRDVPVFEGSDPSGIPRQKVFDADVKFVICLHKCTVCGVCASLCPALTKEKYVFSPENINFGPSGCPAEKSGIQCSTNSGRIKWNKNLCDACGVCVEACPEKAILEATRIIKKNILLQGKVSINKDSCVACGWCSEVCPESAAVVSKYFEGELEINPQKCKSGCTTCISTCPCNAIYVPSVKKSKKNKNAVSLAVNNSLCILCGACVNACSEEGALTLKRTGIKIKGEKTDLFNKISDKLCTPKVSGN